MAGLTLAVWLFGPLPKAHADSPPLKSVGVEAFTDAPAGIKAGGLLFNSSLAGGTIYDSNVFSTHTDVASDRIVFVRPGLTVTTLDPNRKFTFRAMLENLEYERNPSEDRTDYRGDIDGKIRVQRDFEIQMNAAAGRVNEPRSLTRRDIPTNAATPVAYNQYTASTAFIRYWQPLVATTTVRFENDNYFNVRSTSGGTINLQSLDRDVLRVTQEEELRLSHRLRLFSRQGLTSSDYRDEPGFIERDSVKFETVNGVLVGFSPLVSGRFTFRFAEEHFHSTSIENTPELSYGAELTWSPLRKLRLRAEFLRDFGGVNFDLDSVGGRRTRADFVLDYAITSQLFARASFAYLHANEGSISTGTSRVEDTYIYRGSLGYQMNRYWSLFMDYTYERRDTAIDINQFERQIIQASAVARF